MAINKTTKYSTNPKTIPKEFTSVQEMVDYEFLEIGDFVRTLGYYSPGDGGGNDYEIVADGTGTDDGGSYIDLSGSGLQAKRSSLPSAISLNKVNEMLDIDAGALDKRQEVSVKSRGVYRYLDGSWQHDGPAKGPSQVDRLLASATVKGMYVYRGPGDSIRIGYNFGGSEDLPVSEYRMEKDGEGWWRLYGAFTGFATTGPAETPLQVNPKLDGSFVLGNTSGTYTTTVGDKISAYYTGSSLEFRSFLDDRGGVWRFRLNGGKVKDISTYSATSGTDEKLVYDNLDPNKVYFVEAEFMGADPDNPPSDGAARGWVYYRDPDSGGEYYDGRRAFGQKFSDQTRALGSSITPREVISPNGINEFAFKVQKLGSNLDDVWVPYHGGDSMLEDLSSTIVIDGDSVNPIDIQDFEPALECSEVKFIQKFRFKQPGETGTFGFLTSLHTFNKDGTLNFKWSINADEEFQINTWYAYQFISNRDHCRVLYLNDDTRIRVVDFDDGSSFSYDNLNVDSVAFTGVSSSSRDISHGAAMDVNFRSAYAQNKKAGDSSSQLLITSRTDNVVKIYWRTGDGYVMQPGESFQADFRVCAVTGIVNPNDFSIDGGGLF